MGDVHDDVRQLVSQFADDWLGSDEWALLNKLPPMSRIVSLHGISTLKESDEPLPSRLRQLADGLSPLSLLRRDCLDARIGWLANDLAGAAARSGATGASVVVDGFVSNFLTPTQQVLHSFTLGAFRVTGLSDRDPVQLVEDWTLHPRGMSLDDHVSSLVSATETDEPPTSLTRSAPVPKGADLERYHFLSWLQAQLILEGLRLFALSGVFVAQEDFSPDYHYVGISKWCPATCPTTTAHYTMAADRIPELQAFLSAWLPLSPSHEPKPPKEKSPNRLYQALWHLKRVYDDEDWERALLDAVSGMELLLLTGDRELSSRLAIKLGHLLSTHDPGRAASVFADTRQMYNVRSCIAHGDWEAAGGKATKGWGTSDKSNLAAGRACASTAIDYLRKAILAAAYFASKGKDIQTEIDETSLENVKGSEALRKSLEDDASNPLVRALLA